MTKKVEGVGVEALKEARETRETKEALQFLAKHGGLKVYEVEWTCRAEWWVAAESREEVSQIVEKMDHTDVRDLMRANELEVWVSEDQIERSRNFRKNFGRDVEVADPDVAVSGGKLCGLQRYLGRQIWEMLEQWRPHLTCEKCGHGAPMFRWRRAGSGKGLPLLGCPACKTSVEWQYVLHQVVPPEQDDRTLPLFGKDEGVADGAASREG